MGGALIVECHTLLLWCEKHGYGPLALHGISMGGYMASLCATVWPKPISLIPCLSWTTASVVFVDGIMAAAVDWQTLTKQYFSDSIYATTIRSRIQPSIPPRYHYPHEAPDPFAVPNPVNAQNSAVTQTTCTEARVGDLPVSSKLPTRSDHSGSTSSSSDISPSAPPISNVGQDSSQLDRPSDITQANRIDWARQYLPFNLSQLKVLDSLASWSIPESLRRSLDASIWHNSINLIRSFPDNLAANAMSTDPEVREFMRELLDFFTHLGNFSPLIDPRLVLSVTAEQDAYVPRQGVVPLNLLYPGSEIRVLPQSGHVGAYLRNTIWAMDFHNAIKDCLNRQIELHFDEPVLFEPPKSKTEDPENKTQKDS
ncbi:Abhydrolase domain-containing protein-2 [Fasciola gigantica]|uniref:Abhydrolase domain-containing protein-2 n=1 Tax=Fasciola gigantica TaxID=46835 RepID=A0A504YPU7_FASGI|nr:Abhydrolase domain-containing protein-2 [Fasciola gigantica]